MPSLEDQLAAQQYGALKGQPFPPGVLTRITDLSSDQLAHLTSRPPVFVPAPGPGKALAFLAGYSLSNPGTIPFGNLQSDVGYAGDAQNLTFQPLVFANASTDSVFSMGPCRSQGLNSPFVGVGKALVGVGNSADDPSGEILAFSIAAGGAGYMAGDTIQVNSFTGSVFVVDTAPGGVVATVHSTTRGFGGVPGVGLSTQAQTQETLPITGVNQGTQTFTVSGDHAVRFPAGHTFDTSGSNAGTYTIVSATFAAGSTSIVTVEAIPSATVDGNIFVSGSGLTITVTSITPANGTARVWILYTVLDLP